jgi:response regulator RpfG family c-di-GMP phosphodiesterase
VEEKLLTNYQAERISGGARFGLVLGNYRVLERLGAGGMGIVYKGEHLRLPRLVAIKVLPVSPQVDPETLQRFFTEMWAVGQLQHPNIVAAVDAGSVSESNPHSPVLHYFVMEYVAGQDLEEYVKVHGPLTPSAACDLIHQVASALTEAQKHHLVHRDIKPSNILVTPDGQAKLLDFGLARHFRSRLTERGAVLGTLDYVAPEQARDASSVDIRADIYGLGGTLYWCLTGRMPFVSQGHAIQDLVSRLSQPPPLIRGCRPDVPEGLDTVVSRMMAVKPDDRYPTPQAVMRALVPFLNPEEYDARLLPSRPGPKIFEDTDDLLDKHQVLIVDDEAVNRNLCRLVLESAGNQCAEAGDGLEALTALAAKPYDLVLLDIQMPGMKGTELLRRLRENPPCPHLKVIMISGRETGDEMAEMMSVGADDYLTKPFSMVQLRARVKAALSLKDVQDRSDRLNRTLLTLNHELEQTLTARDSDLVHARNAIVLALAELVAHRDVETGAHLMRLQRYCRCLAEEAASVPSLSGQIDTNFIRMLECCAPLHDIGKVALPDYILLKPGKLDPDERVLMQAHTVIGAETLQKVAEKHGSAVAFLHMAIDIARHHHERYDGNGYPDHLSGDDIPLAARILAISDVYDALRSRRVYKPALSHGAACQALVESSPGQFDPLLLQAFQTCAPQFEKISRELAD